MAELSPAGSVDPCPLSSPPWDMNPSAWSQIVRSHGYGDGEYALQPGEPLCAETERQHAHEEECRLQRELGDGDGETASQKRCNLLCAEKGKQVEYEEECRLPQNQHGDGEGNSASQKPVEPLCAEKGREAEECWRKKQHGDGYGYGYRYGDGHGETASLKGKLSAQEEWQHQHQHQKQKQVYAQAGITPATIAEPEKKKQASNSTAQSPETVNGLLEDTSAFSGESKEEESTAMPPKPAWRKLEAEARVFLEPEFVMEAGSWPTLAQARNTKTSEANKSASSKETTSIPSSAREVSASQGCSTETQRHSTTDVNGHNSLSREKYKSSFKRGSITGNGKPSFLASENIPLPPTWHDVPGANVFLPDQSIKGNGRMEMKDFPALCHGSFHYHRPEGVASIPNNSANWPNYMQAYGRVHPGWHPHGRGYGNGNNKHAGFLPPHEQHIGPRNVHPPFTPFMNINPAYYNIPNFQKGNMGYMGPDFNNNTTYFGPSGPPGGIMHSPNSMTIRAMLQKQIEYYFSIENLCKDMYLRSRMDDEGFVPVSLIASFNRVQMLTSSPMLILEALQKSSVIEVKGDRIRRSHDWERWLLPKPFSLSSSEASCKEIVNSFVPTNHTRPDSVNEQDHETSGQHCFDGLSMLPEIKLDAGTCPAPSTGTADGQHSGDTCSAHGTETENRIDGDIPSVSSTGQMSSVTLAKEPEWHFFDESGNYQESSISHGPFGNKDGNVSIDRRLINAEENSFQTSVLLQYGPRSTDSNDNACELDNCSSSTPLRGITMDSDILAEKTKQKNLPCLTNSFLVDEERCPSYADPVYLPKSNKEDQMEVNDRGLINATHAQLSSCIAVP